MAIRSFGVALLLPCLILIQQAHAMDADKLEDIVKQRISGDRTGACLAVARIEGEGVKQAFVCADADNPREITPQTSFEVGSVSKPMMAFLLAELVNAEELSLDDPLSKHVPEGVIVPSHGDEVIRLKHLVTHSSGLSPLPAELPIRNPMDPYSGIEADDLYQALEQQTLHSVPGEEFAYSNFGAMLLSAAIVKAAGKDLETLFHERLFAPLGMSQAHINDKPDDVILARGHLPTARSTVAWNFDTDLAGVGGIRASLDDMTRFVQASLSDEGSDLHRALRATHEAIEVPAGDQFAMHWVRSDLNGQTMIGHEGGTGGFSSLVAFIPDQKKGVVILSDTALHSLGGLGDLGMHILDTDHSLDEPRREKEASEELLEAMAGEYDLDGQLRMTLSHRDGTLYIQPQGQPRYEMGYDSEGDFFPRMFDALLKPNKDDEGEYTFTWIQGGGALEASRLADSNDRD